MSAFSQGLTLPVLGGPFPEKMSVFSIVAPVPSEYILIEQVADKELCGEAHVAVLDNLPDR